MVVGLNKRTEIGIFLRREAYAFITVFSDRESRVKYVLLYALYVHTEVPLGVVYTYEATAATLKGRPTSVSLTPDVIRNYTLRTVSATKISCQRTDCYITGIIST